jgi:predicted ester cyclase
MEKKEMIFVFERVINESFNKQEYSVLEEYFDPNYKEHQFGLKPTVEGMEGDIDGLHRSFPDFNLTIEDIVVEGDKLWARMTARGTNLGGFMGPPNGKSFEGTVVDIIRFKDGKIIDHWGVPDRFAIMAQIGALPARS